MAAAAMLASFPRAAGLIRSVRDTAVRTFRADPGPRPRAFTFPAGQEGPPVVVLGYRGRISDLITVAHEFGHAVQIAASGNKFVPPVNREICAFVSELALLKHLAAELPALHGLVLAAWQARNCGYLDRDGRTLALALKNSRSVYRYCWNYPIARVLASECVEQLPAATLWSVFEDRIPLSGIVTFLGCAQRNNPSCRRACLTIATEFAVGTEIA
jgi:hypothetical protein